MTTLRGAASGPRRRRRGTHRPHCCRRPTQSRRTPPASAAKIAEEGTAEVTLELSIRIQHVRGLLPSIARIIELQALLSSPRTRCRRWCHRAWPKPVRRYVDCSLGEIRHHGCYTIVTRDVPFALIIGPPARWATQLPSYLAPPEVGHVGGHLTDVGDEADPEISKVIGTGSLIGFLESGPDAEVEMRVFRGFWDFGTGSDVDHLIVMLKHTHLPYRLLGCLRSPHRPSYHQPFRSSRAAWPSPSRPILPPTIEIVGTIERASSSSSRAVDITGESIGRRPHHD